MKPLESVCIFLFFSYLFCFPCHGSDVFSVQDPGIVAPQVIEGKDTFWPPPKAMEHGISGDVKLELVVTREGSLEDIKVMEGVGDGEFGMENDAIEIVKTWKMKPGTLDGTPVDVRMNVVIKYKVFVNESSTKGAPIVNPSNIVPSKPEPMMKTIPRVGAPGVKPPIFTTKVSPVRPDILHLSHERGSVVLSAVFKKDGTVGDIAVSKPMKAGSLFDEQAKEALRQWTFIPGQLNGVDSDVIMEVKLFFN